MHHTNNYKLPKTEYIASDVHNAKWKSKHNQIEPSLIYPLTVNVQHDPLADRGRHVVGGDAHEGAHVPAADTEEGQDLTSPLLDWKVQIQAKYVS